MALPNTYQRLSYIETTGTQYIDLGSVPVKLKVVVDCAPTSEGYSNDNIIGVSNNSASYYRVQIHRITDNYFRMYAGRAGSDGGGVNMQNAVATNQRVTVTYEQQSGLQSLTVNGETVTLTKNTNTASHLYLSSYYSSSRSYGEYKIYSCKVYKNDELSFNLIPALRLLDNVPGLYDDASGTFFTNAGSGEFIYPVVVSVEKRPSNAGTITGAGEYAIGESVTLNATANPGYEFLNWQIDGYTRLDYIESSGTQYIDTGISPADHLNVLNIYTEMAFSTTPTGSAVQFLFGTAYYNQTAGSRRNILCGYYPSKSQTKISYLSGGKASDAIVFEDSIVDDQIHFFSIEQNYTDGVYYVFDDYYEEGSSTINSNLKNNLLIFASRNGASSGAPISYYSNAKCYYFAIANNDTGETLRSFVPVKRNSDNVVGLYDYVEHKFYANNGTGTFAYGTETGPVTYPYSPYSFKAKNFVDIIANFDSTSKCRIKVNGNWKIGLSYVKVNGVWKKGSPFIKVNGDWEVGV